MSDLDDVHFMRMALEEAKRGLGKTSPNPAVGAVLVQRGRIVSRGHHRQAGGPHAEIECLRRFHGRITRDATLYVTLEPCSTTGRTGPCTQVLVQSGLKTIVVGALDRNPRHCGRGITILHEAGIHLRSGVLAEECDALNEAFNKWITTGRPFVIAKCGMSLDGRLTRPPGESRWITGPKARQDSHKLRALVDAILVGAETIRADDPRLTVRGLTGTRQPWRVVMTRSARLPRGAKIFRDRFAERTLVYRNKSLGTVLSDLGKKNITSVLIEGGGKILGHALDAGLIDKVQIYLGPVVTGGPAIAFGGRGAGDTQSAVHLRGISYQRIGDNVCVAGYLDRGGTGV